MSIIGTLWSDLFTRKIGFTATVQDGAKIIDAWVSKTPAAAAQAADTLSHLKQGVSTAVSLADTALAPHLAEFMQVTEAALDKLLAVGMGAAGPVGVALTPAAVGFANVGVEQTFQVLNAAIAHWKTSALAWSAPTA